MSVSQQPVWWCAFSDPVISVRVLCLFHNNESGSVHPVISVRVLCLFHNNESGSVHTVIQSSLLGSYVCFSTTCLGTVDIDILLRLCTDFCIPNYCYYKLMLLA